MPPSRIVLLSSQFLLFSSHQPIIVKIVEPKQRSWTDVLFDAVGLTGVIVLAAVGFGALLAAVLLWSRSRSA